MRIIVAILFSFAVTNGYAQYDSILNKTFIEKRQFLSDYYRKTLKIHDNSFKGKGSIIEGMRSFGEKHHDASLVTEAEYSTAWLKGLESEHKKLVAQPMIEFLASCIDKKDNVTAARAARTIGDMYWQIDENYELAFEYYLKTLDIDRSMTEDVYPEKMIDYGTLGASFYSFKEYDKAMLYLKQGLAYQPPHPQANIQADIRNTIGLCYQKLNQLDSADHYFNEVLHCNTSRIEEWKGIAMGNLGYNEYLRGNYEKAMPLLDTDIAIATKYNNPEFANKSIIWLGNIYLSQHNIAKAEEMAAQARGYIINKNLFDHYQFLYPLLSKLYSEKGALQMGQQYLDSALWAKDSVERKFNTMQLARAQQKIEADQKKEEITKLENEKNNKIVQRNILIASLLFLSVLAIFIYRLIKRRHKQEQLVKDLQLEKKQQELLNAEQQLKDFAISIQDKSKLLEQMEMQLRATGKDDEKLLEQLQQTTLLTDEQWNNFRQQFEKVHGGYLMRLKEKLPDLTPGEVRYMALAKLQFSNKEMAAALGISYQTIRVTTHRLRKKLQLTEEGSLAELVASI